MNTKAEIRSPIGLLCAEVCNGAVCRLELGAGRASDGNDEKYDETVELLCRELDEYFSGARREFTLPVWPQGTPFQLAVWEALRAIPYGETCTYGEIAKAVGKPGAARAVGQACSKNPVLLLIPCHRVIAADGMGGFACGSDVKSRLLALEGMR